MPRLAWVGASGGLFTIVASGAFLIGALPYGTGTLVRMGAGTIPAIVGGLGVLTGFVLLLGGLLPAISPRAAAAAKGLDEHFDAIPWRAAICSLGAIAAFALLIRPLGLAPSVFAATVIAALSYPENRLPTILATGLFAVVFSFVVFVWLLGLPLDFVKGLDL